MNKKSQLSIALIVFLTIIVVGSCAPVIFEDLEHVNFDSEDTPAPVEDIIEEKSEANTQNSFVEHGSIRIYYDSSIENYIDDTGEVVPAASGDEMYAPAHPGYSDFNFSPMQAHIYVAPVTAYKESAEFAPALIADLYRVIEGAETLDGCVPELPLGVFYQVCDHQQFVSNDKRISFGNGSGVRFVTVYGIQDMSPVGNKSLVYVFQGITDDGKYYIKAIVELMHSQLEGVGEIPDEIYREQDAETIDAYFAQFAEMFNTSEEDFTPKLDWIDSVMAALSIE